MSGTLFSKTPRRDSPQPPRVSTPNEPQGDHSAPPPPSEGAWLCDEPYKYHMKSSKNSLEMCNEILERHDEKIYTQLKEEINFLMVVAGLFLAIVAAFTIESYKFLQEDKQDTMSDLLVEIVRLLNDTSAQGKAQLPKPFTPTHHAIVINNLWFLSMILNLIAVAMGTFCLQWISALSRGSDLTSKSIPSHESLMLRQLRHNGLDGWGVRYAPEALLFMVQLSIGLFVCGLLYFLWDVNKSVAIPVVAAICIAEAVLCLINLLPFLQPLVGASLPATLKTSQCPYKSPTSWFIHNAGIVLLNSFRRFLYLFPYDLVGLSQRWGWLGWHLCLTGFDWKTYDWTCLRLRAVRVYSALSYLESGLIAALDCFPYEGESRDIISSYLEILVPFFKSAQEWERFCQHWDLCSDERSILDAHFSSESGRSNTLGLYLEHARGIRLDFLNALLLQHLAYRNKRIVSQLLHRRVELYIRVKNSTNFISRSDGSRLDVGRSLDCPLLEYKEFDLDIELKFQFLRCVMHLIDAPGYSDDDILCAAAIVKSESTLSMTLSQSIQHLSRPQTQHMDRPAEEEHTGLLPNQSSPRNIQIGNLSNQPDSGTTSSPPDDLEKDGTESASHDTSVENHQPRTSFESLCLEVRERLFQLTPSDFEYRFHYVKLRERFGFPIEPGPESVSTRVEEV